MVGDPAHLARAQIHHVDFRVAVLGQHERQAIAFRRPGRRAVQAFKVGQLLAATGVHVLNKDARPLLLERHIGDALAIRSKGWRQNRLTRLQQGYAACAVIVGALQGVTGAVHGEAFGGDKQQTGGERALDAGEFLKPLVGNVVSHITQLIHATADITRHHLLLGGHVEQRELHL